MWLTCLTAAEAAAGGWPELLAQLAASRRATRLAAPETTRREPSSGSPPSGCRCFTRALSAGGAASPPSRRPMCTPRTWSRRRTRCVELLRGRLQARGADDRRRRSRRRLGLPTARIELRWRARGRRLRAARAFTPGASRAASGASGGCWRASIATPSSAARRDRAGRAATSCASCSSGRGSRAAAACEGADASAPILEQLEGFEAAAAAWESESCRRASASTSPPGSMICVSPAASYGRGSTRAAGRRAASAPVRATPIALARTAQSARCGRDSPAGSASSRTCRPPRSASPLISTATAPRSSTRSRHGTGLLQAQVEEALAELVALGGRQLRQLRRTAGAAGARRSAPQCRARPAPAAAFRALRHGCGRPLGADRARAARARPPRSTRGAHGRGARDESSSTWRGRCCAAMAWCSGGCWRARPTGCRRGDLLLRATAGSRRAARSAAGASSRA